jgi:hypothetical protein
MPIKKGEKLWQRRKHHRGGRPTKAEAEKKKIEAETAHDIIEKNAAKLANRLIEDAMTTKGRRSLHVAINKLVPDAKHTIAIEGEGLLEQAVRRVRERKNGGQPLTTSTS